MIAFIAVLKNDWFRLMEEKARMILMQIMIAGAIAIAILISTRTVSVGNIALVSSDGVNLSDQASQYLDITVLDEAPPISELVFNKYDAVVTILDHTYDIQTIRGDSFKETLESVLSNSSNYLEASSNSRGTGSTIMGYLVMFMLMQGVYLMYLFAEDKERKQLVRISSSPISFTAYLFAHSLFAFLMLFLPTLVILYLLSTIMGVDIGLSFMQCALLLALLCALATSFSLLLNSLFKVGDSANMSGSAIVVLTSILAGSFYSFEKDNQVLDAIIKFLPQKAYLTITQAVENGTLLKSALPHMIYITILIFAFFVLAIAKTRREYIKS